MSNRPLFIIALNWVDALSLTGLVLALLSLGLVLHGHVDIAVSLLCVATLIDFLDGSLARRFGLCRPFGRHLDSFIDVVDYLIAPTLILYLSGFDRWHEVLVLMLVVVAGVVRLSVFNEVGNVSDAGGRVSFLGMPVFWMLVVLAGFQMLRWFLPAHTLSPYLAVVLAVYALLMLRNTTFFKFQRLRYVIVVLVSFSLLFAAKGILDPGRGDTSSQAAAGR